MNLAQLLLEHPFAADDAIVHTVDRSVTRGELIRDAHAVAGALVELGVQSGQSVVVQLPNGPQLIATMFGVWIAGAVLSNVNPRATASERADAIAELGPAAIIDANGMVCGVDTPRSFDSGTAFVMWTSGTTGAPKPIQQTHDGYIEFLDRVLGPLRAKSATDAPASTPTRAPMPNLIPVSIALNAGLYNVLFGLRAGASLVVMDRFDPVAFAELIARHQIRSTVLPPAAIAMLSDDDRVVDLAPLKYVRSITAPLSPLQARRFTTKFSTFVLNSYGQAELGEVIGWTAAEAKTFPHKIGAVGRAHPGVQIRLDADGHLLVKPPNTASGLGDRVDANGFVDTGDIARIDEDDFVWIEGRVSDMINRGGNKIAPGSVEEVLRLHPNVHDVAVVGASDDRLGEVPVAFLVGIPPEDSALDALCREHLVAYKVPVQYLWVDALPRNEIGKVLRTGLVARANKARTL